MGQKILTIITFRQLRDRHVRLIALCLDAAEYNHCDRDDVDVTLLPGDK